MSQSAPKSDIPLSPFEKIVNGQKCLSARVCPRHPRFLLFHSCNSCDSWLPFGCGLRPLQVLSGRSSLGPPGNQVHKGQRAQRKITCPRNTRNRKKNETQRSLKAWRDRRPQPKEEGTA